jgi:hypothetical protein
MHLALAPTGGRRRCGFRVAGHRLRIVYYQHVRSSAGCDLDTTCVRATSGRSKGRASPHVATITGSDGRACAWNCARNVERCPHFQACDERHRVSIPAHVQVFDLGGYVLAMSGWTQKRGVGLYLDFLLSDYRDIPMSLDNSGAQIEYERAYTYAFLNLEPKNHVPIKFSSDQLSKSFGRTAGCHMAFALSRDVVGGESPHGPTLSQTRDGSYMRALSAPVAKKVVVGQHELVRDCKARPVRYASTAHVCTSTASRYLSRVHACVPCKWALPGSCSPG